MRIIILTFIFLSLMLALASIIEAPSSSFYIHGVNSYCKDLCTAVK